MNDVFGGGIWAVALAAFLCFAVASAKGCNDSNTRENIERRNGEVEAAKACIASQRPAIDCALILRGTGTP